MRLGYIRTGSSGASKEDLRCLQEANCHQILIDAARGNIGRTSPTSILTSRLLDLQAGDEVVVLRLGHLALMPSLIELLVDLINRDIVVQSMFDSLRTDIPGVAHTCLTIGQYQSRREVSRRLRSRRRGRAPALDPQRKEMARHMLEDEHKPVTEVAHVLGVSRATIYRHIRWPEHKRAIEHVD